MTDDDVSSSPPSMHTNQENPNQRKSLSADYKVFFGLVGKKLYNCCRCYLLPPPRADECREEKKMNYILFLRTHTYTYKQQNFRQLASRTGEAGNFFSLTGPRNNNYNNSIEKLEERKKTSMMMTLPSSHPSRHHSFPPLIPLKTNWLT